MLLLFISVCLIIVILILLMFLILKKTVKIVNSQTKSYFVNKLQNYDNLIEAKENKLNEIEELIKNRTGLKEEKEENKGKEYNFDTDVIDLLNQTKYQDKNVFELNKKIDEKFVINYEELIKSISSIKNVEGVLSSLSIDNQWVLVDENIGIEKDRVIDLDRNLRAGIALYNADVIAYNYWLSIPGYRLAMRLIGYKKKKVIS